MANPKRQQQVMERNMDESRKQFVEIYEQMKHDRFGSNEDWAWKFWQASRAAIEIKMPPQTESSPYEHYMPHYTMDADSVESAIRAAGIKVKE